MARSANDRHRILWSELVSQLVCREGIHVEGGREATEYIDREPGQSDYPTGRIAVARGGQKARIVLTPDRLETEGGALRSGTVVLDLSIAYRARTPQSPSGESTDSSAVRTYSSAREAAEALLPRIFP